MTLILRMKRAVTRAALAVSHSIGPIRIVLYARQVPSQTNQRAIAPLVGKIRMLFETVARAMFVRMLASRRVRAKTKTD